MEKYTYENYSNSEYDLYCPYCNHALDYCTADGIPDNGEFMQCSNCDNWLSISAELSIDWETNTLASIELLADMGEYKKGHILHTDSDIQNGCINSQYQLVNGEYVDINKGKKFYRILELNEGYVEIDHFKWLGFCNEVENDQNI